MLTMKTKFLSLLFALIFSSLCETQERLLNNIFAQGCSRQNGLWVCCKGSGENRHCEYRQVINIDVNNNGKIEENDPRRIKRIRLTDEDRENLRVMHSIHQCKNTKNTNPLMQKYQNINPQMQKYQKYQSTNAKISRIPIPMQEWAIVL